MQSDTLERKHSWISDFIEPEISYYRATYTSIETRASYFLSFSSGIATLLILWLRSGLASQSLTEAESSLFYATLFSLLIVISLSVMALMPISGKTKIFGAPIWKISLIQFFISLKKLERGISTVNEREYRGSLSRIEDLEQIWLQVEPSGRHVRYADTRNDGFINKLAAARLTMLISFRRHVQLKAFYISCAMYTMLLSASLFALFLFLTINDLIILKESPAVDGNMLPSDVSSLL